MAAIAAVTLLHLLALALGLVPAHFDEAQYWTYGRDLSAGYYSKPPLVAWLIRVSTDLFGASLFGLRVAAPLCHAWIAWLIFAAARHLFDARTGFWAGVGYLAAPGVIASSGLMTTDPVMMLAWAGALYAAVRLQADRGAEIWWITLGATVGLGLLAKYTMIAFVGGLLGHALFTRRRKVPWRGVGLASLAALVVLSPHLLWLAGNGFVTIAHLGENADAGRSGLQPGALAEFFFGQLGVIGPVFFVAILWAGLSRAAWRDAGRRALLVWLTLPLILVMLVAALLEGANLNWAAPAYVAGSILAADALLRVRWRRAWPIWLQTGTGAVSFLVMTGAAALYADYHAGLPRAPDPFKKMRIGPVFCERVLTAMEETGAETLLSDDRRRLAECAFVGGLEPGDLRVWNPTGRVTNHYEMQNSLAPGEGRAPMIFATLRPAISPDVAARFADAEELETGEAATHVDRSFAFSIWRVEGFEGYGP